ncbi:MAG TPA: uroporphyrinogen decarboxylase family protein, partial [Gammaproteobacteria bacterium]
NGRVPLIGFSGSPWTLATYMIEGGSSKTFSRSKTMLFEQPQLAHQLLGKISDSVTSYLNAQVAAGAQALMIFDTWGGNLAHHHYQTFSLAYMQQIVSRLNRENDGRKVPVILFTKGGGQWLNAIADSGCDGLGLDWTTDIGLARQQVGDRVALQGNMDPCTLHASPEVIRNEVARILQSYGNGSGHVFNLGHGITPEINPEHVAALVNSVHELSEQYHR